MVEEYAEGTIRLYNPGEIPEAELFGYQDQLLAGFGIALNTAKGADNKTLVLGYPGTGKSVFAATMTGKLNVTYNQDFSLLMVDCDERARALVLAGRYQPDLRNALEKAEDNLPTIIAFDEFEGCAKPIQDLDPGSVVDIYSRELRIYASERKVHEKTFLLCVSNFPTNIDISTQARFNSVIYFEATNETAIAEIIQNKLEVNESVKVANKFINARKNMGLATLGFSVLDACKRLEGRKDSLKKASPDDCLKALLSYTGPGASLKQIKQYEEDFRPWIETARVQQPMWVERAKKMLTELTKK